MSTASTNQHLCFTKYDQTRLRLIDIGANLSDEMYKGRYNHKDKQYHPEDLNNVLERAFANHLDKLLVTGTTLQDSTDLVQFVSSNEKLFVTVGCHPTRCKEFEEKSSPDEYYQGLLKLIQANSDKVVAVGECGLDYDRLHFCPKDIQQKYFEKQLELAKETKKPLFLHCRNAYEDFAQILKRHHSELHGGVVHSFTGTSEEAKVFTDLGYFIGINGCSLKTQENIDAMCSIPTEFLMIETDCPWCEIKNTHVGQKYIKTTLPAVKKEKWAEDILVKGRNEPAAIVQVLEVMAGARNEDIYSLAEAMYSNTNKLFML